MKREGRVLARLWHEIHQTYIYKYVIILYVYSNLKQKYRRSVVGFLWSLVAPLLQNLIIGVVFYYLMRFNMPNYMIYLFSGILIYNLISAVIMQSPYLMINNEGYIKKIYIPKLIFIFEVVILETVNFIFIMISLIVLGLAFRKLHVSLYYLYLPVPILLTVLFVTGIGIIISIMSVYFRDLIHIVPVVMQAVFFLTPVLYPMSVLPKNMQQVIQLNPLYYYVELFRTPILKHNFPKDINLLTCTLLAFMVFILGLFTLLKHNNRIVFKL